MTALPPLLPAAHPERGLTMLRLRVQRSGHVFLGLDCVGTLDDVAAGRLGRVSLYVRDLEYRLWHRAWFRAHDEMPVVPVRRAA